MRERLFVYGTLAPGRPNAHVLGDVPGTWRPATVGGELVDHGWGSALGFPAMRLGDGGRVQGVVLESDELSEHWSRLDEFEGDGYDRVLAEAELEDGRRVAAHVYVARGHRVGADDVVDRPH